MARKTKAPKHILKAASKSARGAPSDHPQCGLCGARRDLTRTPCCNNWICDDEDDYVMFSYARNSCFRNHARYTLCGGHASEGHDGRWQDCDKCRKLFETEMYVYFGTNEYNFEVLENPPSYEPTHCKQCGKVIRLAIDGHSFSRGGYRCMECVDDELKPFF
ncbi:MAG: hypothetical protein K2Y29_07155 [Beijerinckiaceae bacterium]|nr:hypothetical protein [Beijerinckiaceae bacterium]